MKKSLIWFVFSEGNETIFCVGFIFKIQNQPKSKSLTTLSFRFFQDSNCCIKWMNFLISSRQSTWWVVVQGRLFQSRLHAACFSFLSFSTNRIFAGMRFLFCTTHKRMTNVPLARVWSAPSSRVCDECTFFQLILPTLVSCFKKKGCQSAMKTEPTKYGFLSSPLEYAKNNLAEL